MSRNIGNAVTDSILTDDRYYELGIVDVMEEMEFWDSYFPNREIVNSIRRFCRREEGDFHCGILPGSENIPSSALSVMMTEDPVRVGYI